MVASFTPNLQLTLPARGDDVGTWDVPVNGNETLIDLVAGGIATIPLNNSNVVLSAAQFQSRNITFNSTLTGNIVITFPTSFTKAYEIQNLCTGSSAGFIISMQTTAAGGQTICCPPGETIDCFNDGVNLKFKNFGRVGEYWDYAGASVPPWVQNCTIQPYLQCNGTTFSSATYPALTTILGSTTTPDLRGRARYALDQGVNRVTVAISGINGNTLFAGGGDQSLQAHTHANTLSDPGHSHTTSTPVPGGGATFESWNTASLATAATFPGPNSGGATTGITISNVSAGSGGAQNMPPIMVCGLMLIRAG
jgi:Phage Tail Collar Domain